MATQSKSRAGQGTCVTVSYSDSIALVKEQIHWTPKGVSLLTKWPFQVGAEVEFAFDHQNERHCCVGVVVACHPLREPSGHFETILYFVETPCTKLQKAACDCKLAPDGHIPPEEEMMLKPDEPVRLPGRSRGSSKKVSLSPDQYPTTSE